MFGRFRKVLGKEDPAPEPSGSRHQITAPGRIVELLSQARAERIVFSTKIPPEAIACSTSILGIYPDAGLIALDELNPESEHDKYVSRGNASFEGRLNGAFIRFTGHLLESASSANTRFYKVGIPEKLYYQERRQDHRLVIPVRMIPFHGFRGTHQQQALSGDVHDLSLGGVSILLEGQFAIQPGEHLSSCSMQLPEHGKVIFSLQVKSVQHNTRRTSTRVCGQFQDMDRAARKKVASAVGQLERERVKRLKGTDQ